MTSDGVAWARLVRSGLIDPFDGPVAVARALCGVQAQFVPPAGLAIRNRSRTSFTASDLNAHLHDRRDLLRLWGQRNTVHVYDIQDWPVIVSVSEAIPSYRQRITDRLGKTDEELEAALDRMAAILLGVDRASRADFLAAEPSLEPWLKWGNVLMGDLVRRGVACHAGLEGGKSYFAHREVWCPELEWRPTTVDESGAELAERYFHTYGPATARDFVFWLGCKASDGRRFIEAAGERLQGVSADGEELIEARDAPTGRAPPPRSRWPLRLLHRFDPLLLAHRDKSWLVDDEQYKAVWRKAGYVEAVVLVKGRIGGTWAYEKKRARLDVSVTPLGRLTKAERRRVEREAESVAGYFEVPLGSVEIG